ncbi:TPX2 family protein, putative isoform 3 [Hibiscus syriacus]|uniref:TPX2 family protein, putative isoform 3 n=1 Tax=Hibiscus syriacus TaxID=106335 RepID=A0A6A3APU2_HIBSY|nr:TPX2 family protein, putative isoform 3 [Hibiscus syriacus]
MGDSKEWSTFSRNKYVEEAERYARPSSVAQKKAFFEALYKTLAARKAAAMLEQAKIAAATETEALHQEDKPSRADSVDEPRVLLDNNMNNESFEKNGVVSKAEIRDLDVKETTHVKNNCVQVNQTKLPEYDKELELSEGTQMEKPLLKSGKTNEDESEVTSKKKASYSSSKHGKTNQDEFEVTSKRKPSHSSSKVSANARTSKVPSSPAKFKAPLRPDNGNNLTPMAKKPAIGISERTRSPPKSSHKPIDFIPAKNSASVSGKLKQSSATPWSENRSARTTVDSSASVSKTAHGRWSFLPTDCSRILSGCRNKSRSPGIFASFSLRTEERAARRKQTPSYMICVLPEMRWIWESGTVNEGLTPLNYPFVFLLYASCPLLGLVGASILVGHINTKSFITNICGNGVIVVSDAPESILVRQANPLQPLMFVAQEQQIPSRQEQRKVSVGSISFLILIRALSTMGPHSFKSTLKSCSWGFEGLSHLRVPSVNLEGFHVGTAASFRLHLFRFRFTGVGTVHHNPCRRSWSPLFKENEKWKTKSAVAVEKK